MTFMQQKRLLVAIYLALSVLFYGALAFAASIFDSHRYEPSGVQYVFLPYIAAPVLAVLALTLALIGWRVGATLPLAILPFVAATGAWLVPEISLADRYLAFGTVLMAAIGLAHLALVIVWLKHRPLRSRGAPA